MFVSRCSAQPDASLAGVQTPRNERRGTRSSRSALYHAGCAAADAAPALAVRGRLPRAGKRAPLIPSLRSCARRVRDALRRPMRCGRCAWGCQHRTDRWARTRRGESLRPFSRARAQSGQRLPRSRRPRPAKAGTASPAALPSDHRLRQDDLRQRTVPHRCSNGPGFGRRPPSEHAEARRSRNASGADSARRLHYERSVTS